MERADATREPRHGWFVAGVFVLAFNMRPAITSLPPIFSKLQHSLGLSSAEVVALATIPIVCFGAFSLATAPLARRFGEEAVLGGAITVVAAGLALRGIFPHQVLLLTVPAAGAIAFINVLLPSLVKRRDPKRAGLLMGLYLASLSVGATIGSAIAGPLFTSTGGSMFVALGLWSVPAALGLVVWLPQLRAGRSSVPLAAPTPGGRGPVLRRNRLAWAVTGFMGLQSLTFYSSISWLPPLFEHRGASVELAGLLVSVLSVAGIGTALLVPMVAHRWASQTSLVVPTVLTSVVGTAGCLVAPLDSAALWTALLGLGQGAALGLALYFAIARTDSPALAASLSAMAQFVGYLMAAGGTLLIGFLHVATGSWTPPFVVLVALTALELVVGVPASRAATINSASVPYRDTMS